jgi:putative spermidine/putrescine transport system permease protein
MSSDVPVAALPNGTGPNEVRELEPDVPDGRSRRGSARRSGGRTWRSWLPLMPLACLFIIGFALPMITVFRFSFDQFDSATGLQVPAWSLEHLTTVLTSPLYHSLIIRTLSMAAITTLMAALLSYPLAHLIHRGPRSLRGLLLAVVLTPMMVSVVVKTFGWTVLLSSGGMLQTLISALGIPVQLLYTPTGVVIGLIHSYMPFMAMSIIASYGRTDPRLEDAARSLGSTPLGAFFRITLPQTYPGLVAGSVLTFVTSMSALVTPQLLGGGKVSTIVTSIYDQAMTAQNWPLASALGIVLMLLTTLILSIQVVFRRVG